MEDGGIWWRMPISAFCSRPGTPEMDIHDQVLWNCFSPFVTVTVFDQLKSMRMEYFTRQRGRLQGTYLFTIDWHNSDSNTLNVGYSENYGQHKCGHVIQLDSGNYAIQPNNRVIVKDPSFTVRIGETLIERYFNTHSWNVENADKWMTDQTDRYYYDINPTPMKSSTTISEREQSTEKLIPGTSIREQGV